MHTLQLITSILLLHISCVNSNAHISHSHVRFTKTPQFLDLLKISLCFLAYSNEAVFVIYLEYQDLMNILKKTRLWNLLNSWFVIAGYFSYKLTIFVSLLFLLIFLLFLGICNLSRVFLPPIWSWQHPFTVFTLFLMNPQESIWSNWSLFSAALYIRGSPIH